MQRTITMHQFRNRATPSLEKYHFPNLCFTLYVANTHMAREVQYVTKKPDVASINLYKVKIKHCTNSSKSFWNPHRTSFAHFLSCQDPLLSLLGRSSTTNVLY